MPYITDGAERIISFTIVGEISGEEYTKEYEVNLVDKYKKMESADISEETQMYYGAEVKGYTCPSNGVEKWRIFYADETNVYLIADDYIHYDNVPKAKNGGSVSKQSAEKPYRMNFGNVGGYSGSEWILGQTNGKENSLAKDWLNMYFNYAQVTTAEDGTEVVTYPNRTNTNSNIKCTAYMLDTTAWGIYAGEYADYAIGGPPLEMFVASYKHSTNTTINIRMDNSRGYNIVAGNAQIIAGKNNIYRKPYSADLKSHGMWIASPNDEDTYGWSLSIAGQLSPGSSYYFLTNAYNYSYYGFRPVVCLKQGVQLLRTGPEEFTIVGME